jgi:quinol monooxygenase YgiN
MAIYMTALWRCRPGAEDIVAEALREFIATVNQNEPGTLLYTALQQADDPANFMTYFIFKDDAAREFHRSTEWVKRFTDKIYPQNLAPVTFTEYILITSAE